VERKKISFSIDAPYASKVMLVGDFNNWDKANTPLKKSAKVSAWRKDLTLKPGKYQYKFLVDGNWMIDPSNSKKSVNSFGTENSIVEVI